MRRSYPTDADLRGTRRTHLYRPSPVPAAGWPTRMARARHRHHEARRPPAALRETPQPVGTSLLRRRIEGPSVLRLDRVAVWVKDQEPAEGFEHQLPIGCSKHKRKLAGGRFDFEYAYFLVHAPAATPAGAAIEQTGIRWQIEEDNEQAKQLTGLDQYQVRKWIPWHRSITCTMLAHAFLAVQRARHLAADPELPRGEAAPGQETADAPPAEEPPPPTSGPPRQPGPMIRLTLSALACLLALTGLVIRHDDAELLRQHHGRTETPDRSRHQPLPATRRPPPRAPSPKRSEAITSARSAAVVPGQELSRVASVRAISARARGDSLLQGVDRVGRRRSGEQDDHHRRGDQGTGLVIPHRRPASGHLCGWKKQHNHSHSRAAPASNTSSRA